MDVTLSSPPPPPPSTSILSSSVSSSVLFFNNNNHSNKSDDQGDHEESEVQVHLTLASITTNNCNNVSTILDLSNDEDGYDSSPSLGEFYVTAHSSPNSSQSSLKIEEKNNEKNSKRETLTFISQPTMSTCNAQDPSTFFANASSSVFKRSLTFFVDLEKHQSDQSGSGSNNSYIYDRSRVRRHTSLDSSFVSRGGGGYFYSKASSSFTYLNTKTSCYPKSIAITDIANHIYRKTAIRGFDLTLMVIGERRLGKSTLVNSLFRADIFPSDDQQEMAKDGNIETTTVHLKEKHVDLHLTVVEVTTDFESGDLCSDSIAKFIEGRFSDHLDTVSKVNRPLAIADDRVHVCLYLVPPIGLKQADVECMLKLHDKVNIIPVIAKADTLTPEELEKLKKSTMDEIARHQIKPYDFPEWAQVEAGHEEAIVKEEEVEVEVEDKIEEEQKKCDEREDTLNLSADPRGHKPSSQPRLLAVIGSNDKLEIDGLRRRVRKYPWGVIEVENPLHCDLSTLRRQLMHHLLDLRETTAAVFYENYRTGELRLNQELLERQASVEALEAKFLLDLKLKNEQCADYLYKIELNEVAAVEAEKEMIRKLEADNAQLRMELKRKVENVDVYVEKEKEELKEKMHISLPYTSATLTQNTETLPSQPLIINSPNNTVPKEMMTLEGAVRNFRNDVKRVKRNISKKTAKFFSPKSNGTRNRSPSLISTTGSTSSNNTGTNNTAVSSSGTNSTGISNTGTSSPSSKRKSSNDV